MQCGRETEHDFRSATYVCASCGYGFTQEMVDATDMTTFSHLFQPGLAKTFYIYPGQAWFDDENDEALAIIREQEQMAVLHPDTSQIPIWRRRPTRKEGPITAWRIWNLGKSDDGWLLCSVAAHADWEGPVLKADARPIDPKLWDSDKTKTAHIFNRAGIHAVKTREQAVKLLCDYESEVYGEVKLWGRVAQFTLGYRAEYCMISKLYLVRKSLEVHKRRLKDITRTLEKRYGCEVEVV